MVTRRADDISRALRHSAKDKNLNRDHSAILWAYNFVSDAGTAVTRSDVWTRERRRDDRQRGWWRSRTLIVDYVTYVDGHRGVGARKKSSLGFGEIPSRYPRWAAFESIWSSKLKGKKFFFNVQHSFILILQLIIVKRYRCRFILTQHVTVDYDFLNIARFYKYIARVVTVSTCRAKWMRAEWPEAFDVLKQMGHPLRTTFGITKRYDGTAIREGGRGNSRMRGGKGPEGRVMYL